MPQTYKMSTVAYAESKSRVHEIFEFVKKYLKGQLDPSNHCSIPIDTHLAGKASQVNDLSIAPI
jgi:hypothetical protein